MTVLSLDLSHDLIQYLRALKGPFLGFNLFPEKLSYKIKNLYNFQISFSIDILFLSYVKLKFWWCLYTFCYRRRINEPLFTIFFDAVLVGNLFDNPAVFKNVEKNVLIDLISWGVIGTNLLEIKWTCK